MVITTTTTATTRHHNNGNKAPFSLQPKVNNLLTAASPPKRRPSYSDGRVVHRRKYSLSLSHTLTAVRIQRRVIIIIISHRNLSPPSRRRGKSRSSYTANIPSRAVSAAPSSRSFGGRVVRVRRVARRRRIYVLNPVVTSNEYSRFCFVDASYRRKRVAKTTVGVSDDECYSNSGHRLFHVSRSDE